VLLLRERRLPVSQMNWTAEAFQARRPDRVFPTGAAFTVSVGSLEEARAILDAVWCPTARSCGIYPGSVEARKGDPLIRSLLAALVEAAGCPAGRRDQV